MSDPIPPVHVVGDARFAFSESADGTLEVEVFRRSGLSDAEIARAAQKKAGRLAPTRVEMSDRPVKFADTNVRHVRGADDLPVGARCVLGDSESWGRGEVLTVIRNDEATLAQRQDFASRGADYAEYEERGGRLRLVVVRHGRRTGSAILPGRYAKPYKDWWRVPDENDHWPRCADCGDPWPCRHIEAERAEMWDLRHGQSVCTKCGKTDGNRFLMSRADGFPERRVFHARRGPCLTAAKRYATEHGWTLVDNGDAYTRYFTKPGPDGKPLVLRPHSV